MITTKIKRLNILFILYFLAFIYLQYIENFHIHCLYNTRISNVNKRQDIDR